MRPIFASHFGIIDKCAIVAKDRVQMHDYSDKNKCIIGLNDATKYIVGRNRSDIWCTMGSQAWTMRWSGQPAWSAYSGRMAMARGGFTLIEALVVICIIAVLAGALIPAVGLVRNRARTTEAKQTLRELQTAFDLYRNEDARRRFPTVAADLSIGTALQEHLEDRRMWQRSQRRVDADGRLLDPWGGFYRYALARPAPAAASAELSAWNWDAAAGRERAWGARPDPSDPLKRIDGALPFAYLWSLGNGGAPEDAGRWILCEDGR